MASWASCCRSTSPSSASAPPAWVWRSRSPWRPARPDLGGTTPGRALRRPNGAAGFGRPHRGRRLAHARRARTVARGGGGHARERGRGGRRDGSLSHDRASRDRPRGRRPATHRHVQRVQPHRLRRRGARRRRGRRCQLPDPVPGVRGRRPAPARRVLRLPAARVAARLGASASLVSAPLIRKMAALFSLDSFAGGFVCSR